MIQQTHLRSFRCLFSAASSCFLFTLYFVVFIFIFIIFIAAGTARHTPRQLRIALGLNLLYIILYIVRVSRSQAARTANWNWLDEIRFQFHEFATRLKLSLLRLDTFIWFASDSVNLPVCLFVCLSVAVAVAAASLPMSTSFPVRRMPQCSERVFLICFWGSMQTMLSLSASRSHRDQLPLAVSAPVCG